MISRRVILGGPAGLLAQPLAYPVWSWEKWRALTGEVRSAVTSEQAGKASLVEAKASDRRVIDVFVGVPPDARAPLEARIEDETKVDGIARRRVRFQVEPGEFASGYLFVPSGSRLPAVVCPHQTTQFAKDEPAGLKGNPRLHWALALARRGYVTFTYDALCFGERHDPATGHYGEALEFYRKHPRWSLMGKMAWDLSRAVDYLAAQDFVDPARIGSAGHSHGGYTTWFAMMLDPRIAVGVSSCGFDTFRYDGNPYRWSHATALMPRVGFYVTSPHINLRNYVGVPDSEVIQMPFDTHQMLALIAPRPLFLTASDDDHIFPNAGWSLRQTEARLRPVYERLETYYFRGGHGFPAEAEQRAFAFIDRWLGR